MIKAQKMRNHVSQLKWGLGMKHTEQVFLRAKPSKGEVFIKMEDATGTLMDKHYDNIITLDAGILAARLFKNSLDPVTTKSNGLNMLAVGTGATGAILSPDAPQDTQRALNNEIARKSFSSTTYRTSGGSAVSYPTNIVDFTVSFSASEAVGALNEMGLLYTVSSDPNTTNPVENGPDDYDDTLDVTGKDIMINYLTFPVISKPNTAVLSITWRLTF
jgi:hypothetical protein